MASIAMPPHARPRRSVWWVVHHWAGLKLGLLLSFILMTGTVATVANEIDWLVNPAMRALPQNGAMAGWGAWYVAAESVPGFTVDEIAAPIESGFAVRVTGEDASGETVFVHINPWSARVQGVSSTETVQDVVRDLHRALMLPTDIGIILVSLFAIPLLLTLVTAFKVYKKWWRGFRRWPRPMQNKCKEARRYMGDLHRLAGLWSLWFITLISMTGLWYLAERLGGEVPESEGPLVAVAAPLKAAQIDDMVAGATMRWPAFRVRAIAFEDGRMTLSGQSDAMLVRDRANQAWFDMRDGRALGTYDARRMTAHQRIGEAADPLHFGTWGGLTTKLLWFAFGLLLSMLSITGTLVCALRLAGPGRRVAALLREMGTGAAVSVLLILFGLAKLLFG